MEKIRVISIIDDSKNKEGVFNKVIYQTQAYIEEFVKEIELFFTTEFDETIIKEGRTAVIRSNAGKRTFDIQNEYINKGCKGLYFDKITNDEEFFEEKDFHKLKKCGLMKGEIVKNKEDVINTYNRIKDKNGFVILKEYKQCLGRGLSKHNSIESILEKIDFNELNALLEFIPHDFSYRLVNVGEEIVWGQKLYTSDKDFRSNVKGENKKQTHYIDIKYVEKEAIEIAKKVSKEFGYEFSGTDVIINKENGKIYLCEINSPFGFRNEIPGNKRKEMIKPLFRHIVNKF